MFNYLVFYVALLPIALLYIESGSIFGFCSHSFLYIYISHIYTYIYTLYSFWFESKLNKLVCNIIPLSFAL